MRTHLSNKKAHQLGKKLVHALVENNTRKAKKYIGKGAEVDQYFWLLDTHSDHFWLQPKIVFYKIFSSVLPHNKIDPLKATHYTPLLYASSEGHTDIFNFLIKVKANPNLQGESCIFSREIINLANKINGLGVDAVTTFRDTLSNRESIYLNDDGSLVKTAAKDPVYVKEWRKNSQSQAPPFIFII